MFSVSCPGKNFPSVISWSVVSIIYGDVHVFSPKSLPLITIYVNSPNILFDIVAYQGWNLTTYLSLTICHVLILT
jgi:hypothetical protein